MSKAGFLKPVRTTYQAIRSLWSKPVAPESEPASRREVRAKYDLAQTTAENRKRWEAADNFGPLSALDPSVRQLMRSRSRLEYDNSPYYVGIIRTLANDTIGTGPVLQSLIGDAQADKQVEAAFWDWMVAARLFQKLLTSRKTKARDGEAFGVMVTNERLANPVKLDLLLIEADMVADDLMGSEWLTDGIELDALGNPISYNVLTEHPGDQRTYTSSPSSRGGGRFNRVDAAASPTPAVRSSTTVLAGSMIHLFDCERPGQIRGVPELASSTQLCGKLRDFRASTMAAADTAARWSAVIESQAGTGDPEEIEALDNIELEPNTALTLPRGWKVGQIKQEHPSTTYPEFTKTNLQEVGRPSGMPYSVSACDNSSSNYSSGRLDRKVYGKPVKVERFYWELTALDVLYAAWWKEARLIPGLLPDLVADLQTPPAHNWRWDGEEEVDVLKENKGTETAIQIGITSPQDECAKRGKDWSVVELQLSQAYGLTVDEFRKRFADRMLGPVKADPAAAAAEQAAQDVQDAIDNGDVEQARAAFSDLCDALVARSAR